MFVSVFLSCLLAYPDTDVLKTSALRRSRDCIFISVESKKSRKADVSHRPSLHSSVFFFPPRKHSFDSFPSDFSIYPVKRERERRRMREGGCVVAGRSASFPFPRPSLIFQMCLLTIPPFSLSFASLALYAAASAFYLTVVS